MSHVKTILVSGPKFSGKSAFVERLLPVLRARGLALTGFLQRGVFDKDGLKSGYNLVSVENGTSVSLARRANPDSPWQFDEPAFARAAQMLDESADVIILDEIGPLELSGGGHAQALQAALNMQVPLLIVVREELAEEFRHLWTHRDMVVLNFNPGSEEKLTRRILEILS